MLEILRSKLGILKKDNYPLGNEMLSETWYGRLPVHARIEVAMLLAHLDHLQHMTGVMLGAIAIGSTTRRDVAAPNDIDIKFLIEEGCQSPKRTFIVSLIKKELLAYFDKRRIKHELEDLTEKEKINPYEGISYSVKAQYPHFPHPLHVHISGVHDWSMKEILEEERRYNRNFSQIR